MEDNIWVNGPLELLEHGINHIKGGNEFDLRIAMISIDNSVELAIKTFLALNKRALRINWKRYSNSIKKFPLMLNLLQDFITDKVSSEELDGIEMFHNLRNSLYHQGNGITVQQNIVNRYAIVAQDLISRLFDVDLNKRITVIISDDEFSIYGEFLLKWRELEQELRNLYYKKGLKSKRRVEPPMLLIKSLNDEGTLKEQNYSILIQLNRFRNEIFHGISNPSIDELKKRKEDLRQVIDKIKQL
jgi:hypothetical protein